MTIKEAIVMAPPSVGATSFSDWVDEADGKKLYLCGAEKDFSP